MDKDALEGVHTGNSIRTLQKGQICKKNKQRVKLTANTAQRLK